jgi:opacity protein-like surface antigen
MKVSIAVVLVLCCLPSAARGQDDRGASVGGGASATNMDSRTQLSFSGAFGYRFGRVVGLEIETTVVPTLKSAFPGVTIQTLSTASADVGPQLRALGLAIFPTPTFTNPNGRAVIFSNNVRVTIPTTTPRLEPFFIAGGGIASVRRTADFGYPIPFALSASSLPTGASIPFPQFRSLTQRVTSSSVDLALTLGGGLSVRVASQMSVDADLRMFRLLGSQDQNMGRFGLGIRYRF